MRQNIDLKLLAQLEALVLERHVTRAAEKFDMSQPQMSATLAKLRKIFGDPLLVRTQEGMHPTRYALDLIEEIKPALVTLNRALEGQPTFNPQETSLVFRIAASNSLAQSCLPRLIEHLAEVAPNIHVVQRDMIFQRIDEWLARAEIDVALGYWDVLNESHIATKLFEQELCVIASTKSTSGANLTFDEFCERRHVIFAGDDGKLSTIDAIVERTLAKDGVVRKVAATVPSLLLVPEIVARTDVVATVPMRLAKRCLKDHDIRIFAAPFDVPQLNVSLVWHEINHVDAAHRWMRDQIKLTVREAYQDDMRRR